MTLQGAQRAGKPGKAGKKPGIFFCAGKTGKKPGIFLKNQKSSQKPQKIFIFFRHFFLLENLCKIEIFFAARHGSPRAIYPLKLHGYQTLCPLPLAAVVVNVKIVKSLVHCWGRTSYLYLSSTFE